MREDERKQEKEREEKQERVNACGERERESEGETKYFRSPFVLIGFPTVSRNPAPISSRRRRQFPMKTLTSLSSSSWTAVSLATLVVVSQPHLRPRPRTLNSSSSPALISYTSIFFMCARGYILYLYVSYLYFST